MNDLCNHNPKEVCSLFLYVDDTCDVLSKQNVSFLDHVLLLNLDETNNEVQIKK